MSPLTAPTPANVPHRNLLSYIKRALVELVKLEEERVKTTVAKAAENADMKVGEGGGSASGARADAELLARIAVVQEGIYKRLKLLATWADLDDEQVRPRGNRPVSFFCLFRHHQCT